MLLAPQIVVISIVGFFLNNIQLCTPVPVQLNQYLQSLIQCKQKIFPRNIQGKENCPSGCFRHKRSCFMCPVASYKINADNKDCKQCGLNSMSNFNRTKCICKNKHFRKHKHKNNYGESCLDTQPKNIDYRIDEDYYLSIKWIGIQEELEIGNLWYILECKSCLPSEYFRFRTKKSMVRFAKPIVNKFYSIQLTTTYIDPHSRLTVELNTMTRNIFVGAEDKNSSDVAILVIVSVLIPIILTFLIVAGLLYVAQRRRRFLLQRKLVSLKRKARPPKPPIAETCLLSEYKEQPANQMKKEVRIEDDEIDSYTIKPYAVLNFKPTFEKYNKDNKSSVESTPNNTLRKDEAYVTMQGNNNQKNKENKQTQDLPYRRQCLPNDYITREHVKQDNAASTRRPRPMSWYLREMATNSANMQPHEMERGNRSQSGTIYQPGYQAPSYTKNIGASPMMHHRSHMHMGNHQWGFTGAPMVSLQEQNEYLAQQYIMGSQQGRFNRDDYGESVWPIGMISRSRTQNCLSQNKENYHPRYLYQKPTPRNMFVPQFPPMSYEEGDIFEEYPLQQENFERRGRSRTFMCGNDGYIEDHAARRRPNYKTTEEDDFSNFVPRQRSRTICGPEKVSPPINRSRTKLSTMNESNTNLLTAFDQIKLVTKYKRAESREQLCAADYVKLKRPHSADDINIVHGMEI